MKVRRLCLVSLLIAAVAGCMNYKEWFGAYKAADQEAAAKRNLDWNKPKPESNEIPMTD